ncbi:MAG: hypothetical protein ACREQJ_17450, partial [Candidatus Binatia bacterium]
MSAAVFVSTIAGARAQTYDCTSGGGAIVDAGYDGSLQSMTCCTAEVPAGECTVADLDVAIGISGHTFVGDLTLKVGSPAGTVTTLMSIPGGEELADDGTAGSGRGANWLSDVITFDDDAGDPSAEDMGVNLTSSQSVCADNGVCAHTPAPGAGPGTSLADFDGANSSGTWMV